MLKNTVCVGIVMLSGLTLASDNAYASRAGRLFETGLPAARTSVFTTIPCSTSRLVQVPNRSMTTMSGAALKRTHINRYQTAAMRRMFSTAGSDSNRGNGSNHNKGSFDFVKQGIRASVAGMIVYSLLPCLDECNHERCTAKRTVYTGTYKYLSKLYSFYRGRVPAEIWDDSCPLKQRSQIFNAYLAMFNKGKRLEAFKEKFSASLPDSPFKTYGELAFKMKDPEGSSTYYRYGIARQLIALYYEYPQIEMPSHYTDLYNAKYWRWMKQKQSPLHFDLDSKLTRTVVEEDGTIYGFEVDWQQISQEGFITLYCCERKSGYALWSSLIKLKSKQQDPQAREEGLQLVLGKDRLYILADEKNIVVLDKKTGEPNNSLSIEHNDLPIRSIGVTEDDHLLVVHRHKLRDLEKSNEANLTFVDLRNMRPTISLPLSRWEGALHNSASGNYFASSEFGTGRVSFFNTKGNRSDIDGDPYMKDEVFKHMPKWTIVGDQVIFDQRVAKDQYQLVAYNLATNQQEWTIPLDSRLQDSPAIGLQKNIIFMLTEKKLTAIKLSPDATVHKSWETSVETGDIIRETITHLQASGDGKFVYGLHEHMGNFYRFEVNTGCSENLGEIKAGRWKHLAGTDQDGQVYVKTLYY